MEKEIMAIISLLFFASFFVLALRGWRKRTALQANLFSEPLEALDYFGELLSKAKALYVATTLASNHLERIAAFGLGPRGNAQVLVFTEGVLIVRNGERPLAIDKAAIELVSTTGVTIDKTVEKGGLITIDWHQGPVSLSTHLRVVNSETRREIISAISSICLSPESKQVSK